MGKEKVCEDELFYGLYGSYVNMSYDCILADEYEAIDFVKALYDDGKADFTHEPVEML